MKDGVPIWILLGERLAALCFLVLYMWALFLVSWLIAITGGSPVLVEDVVMSGGREVGRSLRFRTTGAGNEEFKVIGRFLRRWGIDEWAGFWSVLRGDVRFGVIWKQVVRNREGAGV